MATEYSRAPEFEAPRRIAARDVLRGVSGAAGVRIALPFFCVLLDIIVVLGSLALAALLRRQITFLEGAEGVDELATQLAPYILVTWLAVLVAFGTYSSHRLTAGIEEYKNVAMASMVTAGIAGIACYMAKIPLSRAFFLITFSIGVPLLVGGRILLRRALHLARRHGLFRHRVLIAGDDVHVDELAKILRREQWLGYHVVGALRPARLTSATESTPLGIAYVGHASRAAEAAEARDADVILVAGGAYPSSADLRRTQWDLEDRRVQLVVAPSVTDVSRERVVMRPVAGLPLVYLERPQHQEASRWGKTIFDRLGAAALLLALSPIMLVAAAAVRWHDGGPVFFRQTRVGRDGERFGMLKFRSMVLDAEARLAEVSTKNHNEDGVLFKRPDDPRITRPGKWLRRYSIDEMPQLINVLRGEMSLVGPRPALPSEVDRYDADTNRRLRVRPGLTGLWQVSGRSDLTWEDTVRLDLYYVDNWSLLRDLTILTRTLKAVVGSDGAY